MNKISCVFLSDDIFIINICDEYKSIGDLNLVDIISTCIGFNNINENKSYLLQENINHSNKLCKYKGIVITKKFDDFSSEYVIIDVFCNNNVNNYVNNDICNEVNNDIYNKKSIISLLENMSLDDNIPINEVGFIEYLSHLLNDFIITQKIYNNINYFYSSYDGSQYNYMLNSRTKLDFDILAHNFYDIIGKDSIENIEFNLSKKYTNLNKNKV